MSQTNYTTIPTMEQLDLDLGIDTSYTNYIYTNNTMGSTLPNYTYTTNGTSSSPYLSPYSYGQISISNPATQPGLHVKDNAVFEGDVTIQGKSILKLLEKIEERLALITPDLEKLENFQALKKAYEHYQVLDKLCQMPNKDE